MPKVLISAGHTTKDPGTIVNGIREVDLNRNIAKEVTKILRTKNIITLAVPPDLDLPKRIEWINRAGYKEINGDVVIEIHINDGKQSGIEGWYKADSDKSKLLTQKLVDNVSQKLNWPKQGVKSEYEHPFGSLAFLHNTMAISSLIECGYMDNPSDLKILTSQDGIIKIANGIVDGILDFFKNANSSETKKVQTQSSNQKAVNQVTNNPTVNKPNLQNTANSFQASQNQTPMLNNTPAPTGFNSGVSQFGSSSGAGFSNTPGGGFNSFGTPNNTAFSGTSQNNKFMTREERKEMIKRNYVKILGREPTQSDLNYFLNIAITEQDLIKRMLDSQEHADLVKARQEVIKIKEKFAKHKNELLRLRVKVSDQTGIIKNLNALLMQKNRVIFNMQQKLQQAGVGQTSRTQMQKRNKPKYKKTLSEKVLDFFSDHLG